MKRAALTFAALLASTGCVVHSSPPAPLATVTFYWQFNDSTGTHNCAGAGVSQVRVTIDQQVTTVACSTAGVEGIQLKDFNPGTYGYTLEALDASGTVTYEDQGHSVTVGGRGTDSPVHATLDAIVGDLLVNYSFGSYAGTDCTNSGVQKIAYGLYDWAGNVVSATDSTSYLDCGPQNGGLLFQSLPLGVYSLHWIQGLAWDSTQSTYAALYQECGVTINHTGASDTVNVAMAANPTAACPP